MPRSDGLQPILTDAEREIRKSYGGWTNFMLSYSLKPWINEDAEEGKAIIAGLASCENQVEDSQHDGPSPSGSKDEGQSKKDS